MLVHCKFFMDMSIVEEHGIKSIVVNRFCGKILFVKVLWISTPNVYKAKEMQSHYAINNSWVSQTPLEMFSSHISFQYSINLNIPLMISSQFFMESGLQGFGSPSASIHFPFLSWCHMSIPSFGTQWRDVHKSLNSMAGIPSSII